MKSKAFRLVNISEASNMMGVSVKTIERLIKETGFVPVTIYRKKRLFKDRDIIKYIEKHTY